MAPSQNEQLEARLRRAVPPREADRQFVHRLRRALLNSRQYTEPSLTRVLHSLWRGLPIAAAALAVGFFAALGVNRPTANSQLPTPIVVANPAVLEHLRQQGQIQTVTVGSAGTKIHRIHLTNGETLELLEMEPVEFSDK